MLPTPPIPRQSSRSIAVVDEHPKCQCVTLAFYEKIPVSTEGGQPAIGTRYRYEQLDTGKYHNSLMTMWSFHPPQVGDLVELGPGYRVIGRSWMYSQHGSANWPWNEPMPIVGPQITLLVEREDGPFADEADHAEYEKTALAVAYLTACQEAVRKGDPTPDVREFTAAWKAEHA